MHMVVCFGYSQIVCIRPYSLSTTIAFYFVNECLNIAVSVWLMGCMSQRIFAFGNTYYFTWTHQPV